MYSARHMMVYVDLWWVLIYVAYMHDLHNDVLLGYLLALHVPRPAPIHLLSALLRQLSRAVSSKKEDDEGDMTMDFGGNIYRKNELCSDHCRLNAAGSLELTAPIPSQSAVQSFLL